MGKKALIVADMLNDFIDPQGALYVGPAGREIIPFIAKKIEEGRAAGDLVIFLCDAHDPENGEFRLFGLHAVKGTWGAEVIPELVPQPGDHRVEKTSYSGFYQTGLEDLLRREQVEEVGVMGVCTSICVMETVKELFYRKFSVVVYKDGVADFDPQAHAFALKHMERVFGAKVV
ncbi:MAG: cysteine hydrolase [Deltaproteobacteria bacterium]|nr:cysteine hydrolase [Deltaproteobacteria bacterium]